MSETTDREERGGTSLVDHSSVQKIKPPRLLFAMSIGALYLVVGLVCLMSRDFERFYREMGFEQLPIPTELVLAFGKFLQTKLGMGLAAFSFLCVLLLVLKGTLDKILKLLIFLNVVAIILFLAFSLFGAYVPALRPRPGAATPPAAPAPERR